MNYLQEIAYLIGSVGFIVGIKMMGQADSARRGNLVARHPNRSKACRSNCRSVERCQRLCGADVVLGIKGRAIPPLCALVTVGNKAHNHVFFV